ncbi:MAG TPA: prepilin-type N-terminal cleavage/methylation domain-containing protein [Candidatus Acidoferrum sp.]|nr:prepilin-type N-terminal cleavage/methylation domain-containing protein [Candidatus Acidoferrum sp.]
MRLLFPNRNDSCRAGPLAFTLPEMLIAMTIFSMVIAGMITIHIFGLRVYTLAATKLTATAGCRKALNSIRDQVRQAKLVDIGTCSSGPASFSSLGLTNVQVGNALRLSLTNNWTNGYTLYYLDTTLITTNYLVQIAVTNIGGSSNASFLSTNILASYVTNSDIFTAQDYWGNNLTNENSTDNQLQSIPNRLVVYVKLQFYQWEYPIAKVGASNAWNAYDYYQLRTRITRRAWN